jgi:hypothetical protein
MCRGFHVAGKKAGNVIENTDSYPQFEGCSCPAQFLNPLRLKQLQEHSAAGRRVIQKDVKNEGCSQWLIENKEVMQFSL